MNKLMFLVSMSVVFGGCAADVSSSADPLRQFCGGIAGIACPEGYACVDDARDSCDPNNGGADCGGICRRARRDRCNYNEQGLNYVGTSVEQCSTIRFVCAEGQQYFSNDCGCGCQDTCVSIALCIQGYEWDPNTCSCQPTPGEPCGPVNCASGEVCCNASCGICTPPGYFCTQQACL